MMIAFSVQSAYMLCLFLNRCSIRPVSLERVENMDNSVTIFFVTLRGVEMLYFFDDVNLNLWWNLAMWNVAFSNCDEGSDK